MIDMVQAVLIMVIVVLTVLLVIIGIQVYFILKEFRTTVSTANKVLENTETITESVSEPISLLSAFLLGTKHISKILKILRRSDKKGE